jgi:DNA mismatch repair protein MutL
LLRVLGQVGLAYVVAEGPDGLYLIDQHAAHERVLYEAFLAQAAGAHVTAQALLQPATVEVSPAAGSLLRQQLSTLNALGFDISEFGASAFLVRAIPTVLGPVDATRAVSSVVDELEEDESLLAQAGERRIIARVCKRASVKAGQALSPAEQQQLVRGLEACSAPRTCPHGRPTMIHLSVSVLERQFGRR